MIANRFNDFFYQHRPIISQVKFCHLIPRCKSIILSSDSPSESLVFTPFSSEEVLKITSSLKSSTSSAVDGISSKLLKKIIDVLIHIFNWSLSTGIVPSKLKTAKVNPVFKSGNKHKFTNYRPISILPSISKLLEKVVYNRIYDFITNHRILSPNQLGFRKKNTLRIWQSTIFTI